MMIKAKEDSGADTASESDFVKECLRRFQQFITEKQFPGGSLHPF